MFFQQNDIAPYFMGKGFRKCRKTGARILTLDEQVFQHTVEIVIGIEDDARMCEYLKIHHGSSHKPDSGSWAGQTLIVDDVQNTVFVFLNDFDLTPYWLGVLTHELFHAVHMVFDQIGLPALEKGGQESHAYLLQWLSQKFLQAFLSDPRAIKR